MNATKKWLKLLKRHLKSFKIALFSHIKILEGNLNGLGPIMKQSLNQSSSIEQNIIVFLMIGLWVVFLICCFSLNFCVDSHSRSHSRSPQSWSPFPPPLKQRWFFHFVQSTFNREINFFPDEGQQVNSHCRKCIDVHEILNGCCGVWVEYQTKIGHEEGSGNQGYFCSQLPTPEIHEKSK